MGRWFGAVVVATALAVLVLWQLLHFDTDAQKLDLIRTALAVGAGTGAVMTLVWGGGASGLPSTTRVSGG